MRCHLGLEGTARVTGRMSWAYSAVCLFMLATTNVHSLPGLAPRTEKWNHVVYVVSNAVPAQSGRLQM